MSYFKNEADSRERLLAKLREIADGHEALWISDRPFSTPELVEVRGRVWHVDGWAVVLWPVNLATGNAEQERHRLDTSWESGDARVLPVVEGRELPDVLDLLLVDHYGNRGDENRMVFVGRSDDGMAIYADAETVQVEPDTPEHDMEELPIGTRITFRSHYMGDDPVNSGRITDAWMSGADTLGGPERVYRVQYQGVPFTGPDAGKRVVRDQHVTLDRIDSVDQIGRGLTPAQCKEQRI